MNRSLHSIICFCILAMIFSSVVGSSVALSALAQDTTTPFPRVGLYGTCAGNGTPFVDLNQPGSPIIQSVIDQHARYHEVILHATPLTDIRKDIAASLRAANPQLKMIAYTMSATTWCGSPGYPEGSFYRAYWELVDSYDGNPSDTYSQCMGDGPGFLYFQNGSRTDSLSMNVNLAYRQTIDGVTRYPIAEGLANIIYDKVFNSRDASSNRIWQGIFIDVFCGNTAWMEGSTTASRFDYRRAGYDMGDNNGPASKAAFEAGWKAAHVSQGKTLRQLIENHEPESRDFILIGNCGQPDSELLSDFNGWMVENFPYQNGGTWDTNMFRASGGYFVNDAVLRSPQSNYLSSWPEAGKYTWDKTTENMRRVRFGLASASLGSGYAVFSNNNAGNIVARGSDWFDEYAVDSNGNTSILKAHTGYMGRPLAPYYQMISVQEADILPNAISNRDFETDLSGWKINRVNQADATLTRDTSTPTPSGLASAKITITNTYNYNWSTNFQSLGVASVIANRTYSATFWAKASQNRNIAVVLPNVEVVFPITTEWKRYQVALRPSTSGSVSFRFDFGLTAGDVWFDDVVIQNKLTSLYRRDFEGGTVLVNPDSSPRQVSISAPQGFYFKRINGTSGTPNNGTAVTGVVDVPAFDALFLLRKDGLAPAAPTGLGF